MHFLFALVTVLCITQNRAQNDPDDILCLINSSGQRVLLSKRSDIGNYPDFTESAQPCLCTALPYTATVAQTGFEPNYCCSFLEEAGSIYCSSPQCVCRYNKDRAIYQVRQFQSTYAAASNMCLLRSNSSYSGVTTISDASCQRYLDPQAPYTWATSSTPCRNL